MRQLRSNEDAYSVVCRTYYKIKREARNKLRSTNLIRIGMLDFNLLRADAIKIQQREMHSEEAQRLREVGGGFIRNGVTRKRSAHDGRII